MYTSLPMVNDNLKLTIFLPHQLGNSIHSVPIDLGAVKSNIKYIINK